MTAKQNLQTIYQKYIKSEDEPLIRTMEVAIHFLLAAVLSGGTVLGGCAPFGIAIVAASGAGLCGGASLLGAGLGYLTLHGFSLGLRYLSASILMFALGFCFYDVRWLQRPWVLGVAAGVICGVTGYLYHGVQDLAHGVIFLGEILLTWVATWGCYQVLLPLRVGRPPVARGTYQIAGIIFLCTVLLSLGELWLWEGVSLGRSIAVTVLLVLAWLQGAPSATILGVSLGLGFNLVFMELPYHAMIFGFSALCGGVFVQKSRFYVTLAYALGNGISVFWALGSQGNMGILAEFFLGATVFLCLPLQVLERLPTCATLAQSAEAETQYQTDEIARVRTQLEESAQAFGLLAQSLKTAFAPPENQNDIAVVFDRTATKVCHKCSQREKCWEREYVSTFNALNDASRVMLARGKGEPCDFPSYFSYRCLHFKGFLDTVNEELVRLLYRRQYSNRIRESRLAVCGHYQELSRLLNTTATEIGQEISPMRQKSAKLKQLLRDYGLETQVVLGQDCRGLLQGEVSGKGVETLLKSEYRTHLATCLEVPLACRVQGDRLTITQQEPFKAVAGVASAQKKGESVNGDSNTYFKRKDGVLFVLLCDGMGSGTQARQESHLALRLLENFLYAGVETEQALLILNSALALRGEESGGFTTIDLLELNLITAKASLYKLGGAPSYLKRGSEVRRIGGTSLPVGVPDTGDTPCPLKVEIQLQADDCLLLASDGISGTGDEGWLCKLLCEFEGDSPKEFVRTLMARNPEGQNDDSTAILVKLVPREE